MNIALQILVEGEGDQVFIDVLGYKEQTRMAGGSGEVANIMQSKGQVKSLVVGIVDNDKQKIPNYFKEFKTIDKENDLHLKKHPDRKHYLIVIDPALESWLLNATKILDIEMGKYGFSNLKQLKRITKSQHVGKKNQFKNFLYNIKDKKNTPVLIIIRWIEQVIN